MQKLVDSLKLLFQEYDCEIEPTSNKALNIFRTKANALSVPKDVIEQLIEFYVHFYEVPCLDSLTLHSSEESPNDFDKNHKFKVDAHLVM
ncbi:hypothetical protein RJD39_03295 [Vibrio scophthalmi]|uniref:hypothetical protein n=1 Tax=Vibrio scophthalmi TaxID=45658 RepID=UPI0038737BB1